MKALYRKMVDSNIRRFPNGLIELPVSLLNEYHKKAGIPDEQMSTIGLSFPGASIGEYGYVIGSEGDENAVVQIMGAYYYDEETGESEELSPNKVLEKLIYRRFYEREILFCGVMNVDHEGRMWLLGMVEDNIGVQIMIAMQPDGAGYDFYADDFSEHYRVWFDGKTFYYEPLPVTESKHLLC